MRTSLWNDAENVSQYTDKTNTISISDTPASTWFTNTTVSTAITDELGQQIQKIETAIADLPELKEALKDFNPRWQKCKSAPTEEDCNNRNESIKKEDSKNNMKKNMMGNFDFGFCTENNVKMSPYGLAIQNREGTWVSYDVNSGDIIDVDIFNFNANKFLIKLPVAVKDVAAGDIVIHQRKPMFVIGFEENSGDFVVVDVFDGEKKTIMPTKNMFGFNFMTKICSLFPTEGFNFGKTFNTMDPFTSNKDEKIAEQTPSEMNPFGNILPFILLDDGNMDFSQVMMLSCLMNNSCGSPLMYLALLGDGDSATLGSSDSKDLMQKIAIMSMISNR